MELNNQTKLLLSELQAKKIIYKDANVGYSIISFNYLENSLTAKITFLKTERYKTIVRYVQRDYERYPIYSDWKRKTTEIKKTLKINNEILERLNYNEDFLIRNYAYKIIEKLNNVDFVPSWAWIDIFNLQCEKASKPFLDRLLTIHNKSVEVIEKMNKEISTNNLKIEFVKTELIKPSKKLNKLELKLKKSTRLRKIKKLEIKIKNKKAIIDTIQNRIDTLLLENQKTNELIKIEQKEKEKKNYPIKKELRAIKEHYEEKINRVEKLTSNVFEVQESFDFIPLKNLSLLEYKKITGVYIIKNNEKNKYYVGQSKDVLKRLKQHFKSTIPNNIIFAEDYFLSSNKDDLFSVKIISLKTKDELDNVEKQLIEEYDAFNNGYNKTNGNK